MDTKTRRISIPVLFTLLTMLLPVSFGAAQETPTAQDLASSPAVGTAVAIEVPEPGESRIVDQIKEQGKLRAGVAVSAPLLLRDPSSGKLFGPAITITERMAEELGVEIEYVDSNWDVIIAGLQANKFDVAIAPLFASEERREVVDFVTYYTGGTCYFARKDNDKVNSLEDMNSEDITIVTYTGTAWETEIPEHYPNLKLRSIVAPPGSLPPFEEVLARRADVGPFDAPLVRWVLATQPDLKIIPSPEECMENPDFPAPVGMAFPKGDPAFSRFLESIVQALQPILDEETERYSDPKYVAP